MDKDKAAAFIEEKRKEKGLTQQQVAEALHVTRQAVSKWENDVSYPDITLLKPLSRAFGVSVDELLDGGEPVCGESYLFAVQIGQTYGGGFRICPDAAPDDGLFDICIAHPPLTRFSGTLIFLMAKDAHHTRFKQIEFLRAASIDLRFDAPLPVQIDGEALVADSYHISIAPRALRVVVPYQGESALS